YQLNGRKVPSVQRWGGGFRRSRRCRRLSGQFLRRDSTERCQEEEGRACRGWLGICGVVLFLVRRRTSFCSSQRGRAKALPLHKPTARCRAKARRYETKPQKKPKHAALKAAATKTKPETKTWRRKAAPRNSRAG